MDYNIFCVGDSITYGLNDSGGGWCDRLKAQFLINSKTENSFRVWNFGISGQTVTNCLEKDERYKEPISRIKPKKDNIFILAFGANDAAFDEEAQEFLTPKIEFKLHYTKLIEFYSTYGRCVVVGITPVSNSIDGIADKYNCYRKDILIKEYNQLLKEITINTKTTFIDIYKEFGEDKEKLLSLDGLHPNSEGHKLIQEKIKQEVLGIVD